LADVQAATARGRSLTGTVAGTSDCPVGSSKARAQPMAKTRTNSSSRDSQPASVATVMTAAQTA